MEENDSSIESSDFMDDVQGANMVEPLSSIGATSLSYRVNIDGKSYFMKQLRPDLCDDLRFKAIFQKEYEVGISIDSEYIVKYDSIGENRNGVYLLMEYVNGHTVRNKIKSEPEYFTDVKNFIKFFLQLLRGIRVLHDNHVAYVDLNPDNVMLTQIGNDVKIVDLGFCFADSYAHTVGCTECYSAPELKTHGKDAVDERTDIYAIGKLMQYIQHSTCARIPRRLSAVISKCIDEDKAKRYATVDAVIMAIRHALNRKRRIMIWTAVAALAIVLAVMFARTEQYEKMCDFIEWSMHNPDYEAEIDGIYYQILSEDSATCQVVGSRQSLKNVYILDKIDLNRKIYSVVAVADSAFNCAHHINSIHVPEGVRTIGHRAFRKCSGLSTLTIPNSATQIGVNCCWGSTGLMSLKISENMNEVSTCAFSKCLNLRHVTVPEGVETLSLDAFAICQSLETVSLPSTLKTIERGVFWRCSSLTEISIPASVSAIGEYVFLDCTNLTDVYNYSPVPQPISRIFNHKLTVHVPPQSVELYKTSQHWNEMNIVPIQ